MQLYTFVRKGICILICNCNPHFHPQKVSLTHVKVSRNYCIIHTYIYIYIHIYTCELYMQIAGKIPGFKFQNKLDTVFYQMVRSLPIKFSRPHCLNSSLHCMICPANKTIVNEIQTSLYPPAHLCPNRNIVQNDFHCLRLMYFRRETSTMRTKQLEYGI